MLISELESALISIWLLVGFGGGFLLFWGGGVFVWFCLFVLLEEKKAIFLDIHK